MKPPKHLPPFKSDKYNPDGSEAESTQHFTVAEYVEIIADNVQGRANEILSHTDWYIIRSVDPTAPAGKLGKIPKEILDERQAIRDVVEEIGEKLGKVQTPADLEALQWVAMLAKLDPNAQPITLDFK